MAESLHVLLVVVGFFLFFYLFIFNYAPEWVDMEKTTTCKTLPLATQDSFLQSSFHNLYNSETEGCESVQFF